MVNQFLFSWLLWFMTRSELRTTASWPVPDTSIGLFRFQYCT